MHKKQDHFFLHIDKEKTWGKYESLFLTYAQQLGWNLKEGTPRMQNERLLQTHPVSRKKLEELKNKFIQDYASVLMLEENHFMIVYKPAGILSQPDHRHIPSIIEYSQLFLKIRDSKPGKVFLSAVNRLDRVASGLMIMAKTSKGASRISASFRERQVKKKYYVVVHGELSADQGQFSAAMTKNKKARKIVQASANQKNMKLTGKQFQLNFQRLKSQSNFSLLEIEISTGYFHQIRALLGHNGFPIIGDKKYGYSGPSTGRIALVCHDLQFPHPTQNKTVRINLDELFPDFLHSYWHSMTDL